MLYWWVGKGNCKVPGAGVGLKPMAQSDCNDFNKKLCRRGPGFWTVLTDMYIHRVTVIRTAMKGSGAYDASEFVPT